MHLRDHPKLNWNGLSTWPPQLGGSYGPGTKFPLGEESILKAVRLHEAEHIGPARLQLEVEHEGDTSNGNLLSDDTKFLQQLHEMLKGCFEQPIQKIGNLETVFCVNRQPSTSVSTFGVAPSEARPREKGE